jgi:hypothetical protein
VRLDDLLSPRALLVALVGVCLLALVVAGATSSSAFGAFNAQWDGSSSVRSAAETTDAQPTIILETTAYSEYDPNGTVAFVIAPSEPYTSAELARMRQFVQAGGTLIVAEDFEPQGDELLSGVGADARFDGRLVRDMRYHGPTTAMPTATNVSERFSATGVGSVMLNHGTVVSVPNESNATTLVATSEYSYLDVNDDGQPNDGEPFRSYPVVVAEDVGEGRVLAVSDPSIFINAMQERADNRAFTERVVRGYDTVVLDYSHADSQPPIRSAFILLRGSPLVQVGVGLVGLLFAGVLAREGNPLRSRRGNEE